MKRLRLLASRAKPEAMLGLILATAIATADADTGLPDPLDVAAQLLKDGYAERAVEVLDSADNTVEPFNYQRFYTLSGIAYHQRQYPLVSNIYLQEAQAQGEANPALQLYIAKNHWRLQEYEATLSALTAAPEQVNADPQMLLVKADSLRALKRDSEAWQVLSQGSALFPDDQRFALQKFYYLLDLGFYQAALEQARTYLKKQAYTEKEYLAVAYALREAGQYQQAAELLEEATLRHPGEDKLVELLGQVYLDQEHYLAAATVLDMASIRFPRFAHRAAALYLKAEQPIRSLQLNRRIVDQADKFRQRLSIDIFLEDYESLAAKVEPLKRYNLMQEDDILYAIGYAFYRNQDYDKARQYLKRIKDGELFARASTLFSMIERCQHEPDQCV